MLGATQGSSVTQPTNLTDDEAEALSAILRNPPERSLQPALVHGALLMRGHIRWVAGYYLVITARGVEALRQRRKTQLPTA
jgi:hypothetical protein